MAAIRISDYIVALVLTRNTSTGVTITQWAARISAVSQDAALGSAIVQAKEKHPEHTLALHAVFAV
jgi:hypothetical protein